MKTYSVFEEDDVDVRREDFISDRVMKVTFGILDFLHELFRKYCSFFRLGGNYPLGKS